MITHMLYDDDMIPEMLAGIRLHWGGLFQFGAPDVVVVNVTKDAIWTRRAALPDAANPARPSPREARELFDLSLRNTEIALPEPRRTLDDVQEQFVRDREIEKEKYYPRDVDRDLVRRFPEGFRIDLRKVVAEKVRDKVKNAAKSALGRD